MKSFACGDVIPGCTGQVAADDEEGILAWAGQHAPEVHGVEVTPELVTTVRSHIASC
jgi:predicted small metal-binding protein